MRRGVYSPRCCIHCQTWHRALAGGAWSRRSGDASISSVRRPSGLGRSDVPRLSDRAGITSSPMQGTEPLRIPVVPARLAVPRVVYAVCGLRVVAVRLGGPAGFGAPVGYLVCCTGAICPSRGRSSIGERAGIAENASVFVQTEQFRASIIDDADDFSGGGGDHRPPHGEAERASWQSWPGRMAGEESDGIGKVGKA